MAKKVIWSKRARTEQKEIFNYWNVRNYSKKYSNKLNSLFQETTKLISSYPEIGKPTDTENVRVMLVENYLLIYEQIETDIILILTIWDARQNPDKLSKINSD